MLAAIADSAAFFVIAWFFAIAASIVLAIVGSAAMGISRPSAHYFFPMLPIALAVLEVPPVLAGRQGPSHMGIALPLALGVPAALIAVLVVVLRPRGDGSEDDEADESEPSGPE